MTRPLALTPCLTGEPVLLGPEITSVPALLVALGLPPADLGALSLAPGVALVRAPWAPSPAFSLRVAHLPHGPRLGSAGAETRLAFVLTTAVRDAGRALRLVGRLRAGLADPARVVAARAARTREDLVRALAPLDGDVGEAALGAEGLFTLLASGAGGLEPAEAARRLEDCGPNRIERASHRPLILRLLEHVVSFLAILLWIGGGLAMVAGMPELGWSIFAVIVINGIFSFLQEYRAERAAEALAQLLPHAITVIRGGTETRVATVTLVPGDVVRLEEGDQVPADGQLLTAEGLRVDQSALTGEAHPAFKMPLIADERERVPRLERHELVFAGTAVVSGAGTIVLTATGMGTEIGGVAQLAQAVVPEPSPLQREMGRVTRVVTALALGFGLAFFALGVATGLLDVATGFVFALGVIVANVPEGLLPTLTLALALAVARMARRGTLVKRLSAVETLGATTVICTDKTGTLTTGRMAARAFWVSGRVVDADSPGPDPAGALTALLEAAVLASQATTEHGDPTEVALVTAAIRAGIDPEAVRRAWPVRAAYPFDSFRKRITFVRAHDASVVAYVKGAPREMLELCATARLDGRAQPVTADVRRRLLDDHDRMAADGLRLLAVGTRVVEDTLLGAPQTAVERALTLVGLVALWDPPRPEVPEAVALCRRAGVRVIMVTGDYGVTAAAIGRRIGLPVETLVAGDEVERMSPDALRRLAGEPGVLFARTTPAHKLAIVQALRAAGEVVAVTGDGVNDAPALRAAPVGVAMGRRGTEVAKESAEVVITDDNFASIVVAIRQGRAVYANMGKFVTYIFASNVPELVPFLVFVLFGIPLPLTVMQILAVDLGTDVLPALALGAEPPEPGVMDRPPRRRQARLLGPGRLLHAYGFLGVIEAGLSLGAFFRTYWLAGWRPGLPMAAGGALYRRATTATLAGIVAAQVGNVFACRTERESVFRVGIRTNPLVFAGIATEIGVLGLLILVPPLARLFELAPLSPGEWWVLLFFPGVVLGLEEARKALVRRASGERR